MVSVSETEQPFNLMRCGDSLLIEAKGNLVASTVQGQRDALLKELSPSPKKVVFDLNSSEQVDSLGINLIVSLFQACNKASVLFEVQGLTPNMMRLFELFSLQKLFPVTGR
jgi:anti-anti-sigma factor